jgi:UPF0755 protein
MKRLLIVVSVILLLGAVAAAVVGLRLYRAAEQPYRGYPADAQVVDIPAGLGTQAIGQRLVEAGVVRDTLTYRIAMWRSGYARRLQAGEYRFEQPMTAIDVLAKIARGEVDLIPLTFPEGRTVAEMSKLFEQGGFGTAASFVAAAREASLVHDLDPGAADLEGYLFPDTYALSRRADAAQVIRAMVDRFRRKLTPDIQTAAAGRGLSVRQLVTLASIVEKETGRSEERPMVASVYANRLKIGMALQCDPTVIYALQRAGRYDGNLHRDDLQFDSPYNTYRYPGLPPGPVAAPGQAALQAAAQPAESDYLFFVSRNDGTHAFARSLAEHNQNVQKFQILYFREKRLAEKQR